MEKAVTSRATERLEKIWKDKNEDYEEDKKHKFVKNVLLTWSSVWKMYFFLKKKNHKHFLSQFIFFMEWYTRTPSSLKITSQNVGL